MTFETLGLIPELVSTVTDLGYIKPTPIQAEAIPFLLAGHDVMGQAQTGTGKTAAFTLPMLNAMRPDGLQALVLTPTRELAIQVSEAVHRYGSQLGLRVLPIYGGQPIDRQIRRLEKGVQVVVGTPGRTLDLIRQKALKLGDVRYVVLDEADEMLKMGFIEDIESILKATRADLRQTALFSATMPKEIRALAQQYMRNPVLITLVTEEMTVENVNQRHYLVQEREKIAALCRLLEVEPFENALIFARTRVGAAELAEVLISRHFPAEAIHGDLAQQERERLLRRFRAGQLKILVATDVMARGLDIPAVSHVINFDIPQLGTEYVHRIGRTGRAGRGGDAITLITPRQRKHLKDIEQHIGVKISREKLPSPETVLLRRDELFRIRLLQQMNEAYSEDALDMLEQLLNEGHSPEAIAAAALTMLRVGEAQRPLEAIQEISEADEKRERSRDSGRDFTGRDFNRDKSRSRRERLAGGEEGMVRLQMGVGRNHGIRPADVVYTIASAASIPGSVIGAIDIRNYETYVDVPEAHVEAVLDAMQNVAIRDQEVTLVHAGNGGRGGQDRGRDFHGDSRRERDGGRRGNGSSGSRDKYPRRTRRPA